MGKCVKCGKSGIFLKLDKSGLCADCSRAREAGISVAREYLAPISAAFDDIKQSGASLPGRIYHKTDVMNVPTKAEVERLRGVCSDLCEALDRWSEFPYLTEAILAEAVPSRPGLSILEHPSIPLGVVSEYLRLDEAFPELEKKVKNLVSCLSIYGNYQFCELRIVGVTFKNEDGSDRQAILKKIRYRGAPFRTDPDITLKRYLYEGEEAIAVYANESQIGHLSRSDVADRVLPRWDRFKRVSEFSIHGDGTRTNKFGMDITLEFEKP